MYTIEQILKITSGKLIQGDSKLKIKGISIDSRLIKPGEIFIAIKGNFFDGHNFVKEAVEKGKRGAIVMCNPDRFGDCQALIYVKDTLKALGDIAASYRMQFDIPVVAITGSNGKTTTKEMVYQILSNRLKICKSQMSFNNLIGLPITLLQLNNSHNMAVVEMGTDRRGMIKRLAQIAKPKIAIFTNIGFSHTKNLGSLKNVLNCKMELAHQMQAGSFIIINNDDKNLVQKIKYLGRKNIITYGIKNNSDFEASQINPEKTGFSFVLNGKLRIKLNILGFHNIYNALAASACAKVLGFDYSIIKESLEKFVLPPSRLNIIAKNNVTIIDDSYNSNPQSSIQAISTLSSYNKPRTRGVSVRGKNTGRKIIVFGDMLELGKYSKTKHKFIGEVIAKHNIDILIAVGKNSFHTWRACVENNKSNKKCLWTDSAENAIKLLQDILRLKDVILVKGSRDMHMEKVVEALTNG